MQHDYQNPPLNTILSQLHPPSIVVTYFPNIDIGLMSTSIFFPVFQVRSVSRGFTEKSYQTVMLSLAFRGVRFEYRPWHRLFWHGFTTFFQSLAADSRMLLWIRARPSTSFPIHHHSAKFTGSVDRWTQWACSSSYGQAVLCLSVCLSACLSICLSVCLSVFLTK